MRDLQRDERATRIVDAVLGSKFDEQLGELRRDIAEYERLYFVLELATAHDHEARHREAELRMGVHQLLVVDAIDLGEQRVLDRFGHLGARASIEQATVAEQFAGTV